MVLLWLLCLLIVCISVDRVDCLIKYERLELLHIRDTVQQSPPRLLYSSNDFVTTLIPSPESSSASGHNQLARKRGRRAGALVRLRRRKHRCPLPSIILSNVRSLANKTDELSLLISSRRDVADCSVMCFTETWLHEGVPDSAILPAGFSLFRADRTAGSLKQKGGGVSFLVNDRWCTNITTIYRSCSPELEALIIQCRPFYLPREFASIILVAVYIPPQAVATSAIEQLSAQVTELERAHPDSVLLLMGDFNHVNLNKSLPRYKRQIHLATRGEKTLDQCYCTLPQAFRAVSRAPLGQSDHNMIFLIPQYRQQLKTVKRSIRTIRQRTPAAEGMLIDCMEQTAWNVFSEACDGIDEFTDTVTSYINFVENVCFPSKPVVVFSNNKPWFNKEIKQLCIEKNRAFKSGDKDLYRVARYEFERAVKKAKTRYRDNLEDKLKDKDSRGVWQGLQRITGYKTKRAAQDADPQLPDKLNEFYCRFDRPRPVTAPAPSTVPVTPPFVVKEHEVKALFRKQNVRKAAGPDGVSALTLKNCAHQLASVFTDIFNWSLCECKVPACFKSAVIIPVPKKSNTSCLNDYRPVALTSIAMKVFERLICKQLASVVMDSYQFAYCANRSVDDAVSLCLHSILQHLEAPATYARVLFIDYSSAFNTIIPTTLFDKFQLMGINQSLCHWILNFLSDRRQVVKIGNLFSKSSTLNTGAPQGCVLSPLLYSLYTNDCVSHSDNVKIFKYADDTTVVGLISNNCESSYRSEVEALEVWCKGNNLFLNVNKTKELIIDFRKNRPVLSPLIIDGQAVERVSSFKFLGTTICQSLKWEVNTNIIISKAHQRLHFLRQLRRFGVARVAMLQFYRATVESVLAFSITVWYSSSTSSERKQLERVVRSASKIIGQTIPSIASIYATRANHKAQKVLDDPSHPARYLFKSLPSGRRVQSLRGKTSRFCNSTYPAMIRLLNTPK